MGIFSRRNNWRKAATVLAAVYSIYDNNYDAKESFIKALEFRYKPPRISDLQNLNNID